MLRNLILLITLLGAQVSAETPVICVPQSWPAGTTSLDEDYAAHSLVFVANVSTIVDPETLDTTWSYRLLPPALKGDIPSEGSLKVEMRSCLHPHIALDATMLIFIDDLDETARSDNSVAIVYGEGNVVENWILEWIAEQVDDR